MGKYDPAPTVAGGLVRLARIKAGLTQTDLAQRAGVSQQAISAYETGRKEPTLPTLLRLIGATGYELRFRLEPADDHDASLEAYLETLTPDRRAEIEREQRRRVEEARLKRVRGR
ncbi:MAG: helix-turn-helix domain-containing protein [Acidimicrobiia bacterium]